MPTWNMFSDEVAAERQKVRNYGVDKIENFPGMSTHSYKAQALRELAKRLVLQDEVKSLKSENGDLINKLELLEIGSEILTAVQDGSVRRIVLTALKSYRTLVENPIVRSDIANAIIVFEK
jgi:hypothetical protein